jgi:hypothetical protein
MTAFLNSHLKAHGFWRIRIIPEEFHQSRINEIQDLRTIIRQAAVQLGASSFPAINDATPSIGVDWIGNEIDAGEFCQTWRLYQSAQLVLYEGFIDDWLDRSLGGAREGWQSETEFSVGDALVTYWQAFELAARLAVNVSGEDPFNVSVHPFGLRNRRLTFQFRNRSGLRQAHVATLNDFPTSLTLAREALVAAPVDHAVASARQLFARFGWDVDLDFLRTLLGESGVRV